MLIAAAIAGAIKKQDDAVKAGTATAGGRADDLLSLINTAIGLFLLACYIQTLIAKG